MSRKKGQKKGYKSLDFGSKLCYNGSVYPERNENHSHLDGFLGIPTELNTLRTSAIGSDLLYFGGMCRYLVCVWDGFWGLGIGHLSDTSLYCDITQ
jgi:hypothetical protein